MGRGRIMPVEKTVDYRFKVMYAIGITMVVIGHIPSSGGITILPEWFPPFGFHLALFVFCSGYFYKNSNEKSVLKYIRKKIRTLIIPLYLYNIIYGLFVQATRLKGFGIGGDFSFYNIFIAPITDGHQFIYNLGGWFVIPLFIIEICNVLIRKCLKWIPPSISEWILFILSIALGITGNQLACMGYLENWWLVLVRVLYFLPFYALGIIYKTKLERYDRKIPHLWFFAGLILIKLVIILHYGKVPMYTVSRCNDFTEGPVMPVIIGFTGIAFSMRIANIISPAIGKSRCVNAIADNAYSIMMNQFLGFMIIKTIYAVINKLFGLFPDFDWISYKSDLFWYYMPKNVTQTLIVYVFAGLIFPILLQKGIRRIKNATVTVFRHGKANDDIAPAG